MRVIFETRARFVYSTDIHTVIITTTRRFFSLFPSALSARIRAVVPVVPDERNSLLSCPGLLLCVCVCVLSRFWILEICYSNAVGRSRRKNSLYYIILCCVYVYIYIFIVCKRGFLSRNDFKFLYCSRVSGKRILRTWPIGLYARLRYWKELCEEKKGPFRTL